MMWQTHDGMGWWMVFGGAVWLLFWGSIVWLIVSGSFRGEQRPPRGDPIDIARERYARGEIDRAAYEQLLQDLRRNEPSHTQPVARST
jgi:putative membrane protein